MNTSKKIKRALSITTVSLLATSLQASNGFDPSNQPLGVIGPVVLSNKLVENGIKAYRTWFENGAWQGDLIEYDVSSTGALSTTIDLTAATPQNTGAETNWSALLEFDKAEKANANYWDVGRRIITYDGSKQVAFRWGNLSDTQKEELDVTAYNDKKNSSDILDFVRGDRSNAHPSGSLRNRVSILADMMHSNPVYVAAPNSGFADADYAKFVTDNLTRDERIYIGSNDGMLHVFDADDGKEVYAYVPSMVIGNLDQLAGRPYKHLFSVDGRLTVRDAQINDKWRSMLVGGLGAGGKGWFALDITSPDLGSGLDPKVAETKNDGDNGKVKWELTTADGTVGSDLGYSFGRAVIAKLNDGKWYAVMGNGYGSSSGTAKLLLVNLTTGAASTISTGVGDTSTPNGLSEAALVDVDGDGKVDVAYAGDLLGNMWKFSLGSSTPGQWKVDFGGKPLHPGTADQPITVAPTIGVHPVRGFLVVFGTGRLLTESDMAETADQAIFGIWDLRASSPPNADNQALHEQTLSEPLTYTSGDIVHTVQTITSTADIDWDTKDGWKLTLPSGLRALTPVRVSSGRLTASVHNPITDENFTVEVNYIDGGAPDRTTYDLNEDGKLDAFDNVDGNDDSDTVDSVDIVALLQLPNGLMSELTVVNLNNGLDAQYVNYLVPPVGEPCMGNCSDGFQGGHIDVDTDYWDDDDGTGGGTYKHSHEYDKDTGRVYVDYMDHAGEDGHVTINDSGYLNQNSEWVVVVANADLSPGSILSVGNVRYNVVEYQRMIQRKLREWAGGTAALEDDKGRSLIFTAKQLTDAGQTVRHDFNDMAIVAGGVHPTNTGCVNKGDSVTKGRYRNGSLVTQFINKDVFTACVGVGCSLDKIIVQQPTDLPAEMVLADSTRVPMGEDLNGDGVIKHADYEVYGGVRGVNGGSGNDDTLFESTIFWHYPGKPCYGDDGWDEEVGNIRDQYVVTEEEFQEALADAGITNLDEEYQRVLQCLEANKKDKGCKQEMEVIEELLAMRNLIPGKEGEFEGDGETAVVMKDSGDPKKLKPGDKSDIGVSLGRRTWVDIFDE